jgi:hypothetical protein
METRTSSFWRPSCATGPIVHHRDQTKSERLAVANLRHDTHRSGQQTEIAERKVHGASLDLIAMLSELADAPIQLLREGVAHRGAHRIGG